MRQPKFCLCVSSNVTLANIDVVSEKLAYFVVSEKLAYFWDGVLGAFLFGSLS